MSDEQSTSHHESLLAHARALLESELGPSDIRWRRSVSAAYYAVFHMFAREATDLILADTGLTDRLGARVIRAFEHGKVKEVAEKFAKGREGLKAIAEELTVLLPEMDDAGNGLFESLIEICRTFIDLQEWRHHADYDLSKEFTRSTADQKIVDVERAFRTWNEVRQEPLAKAFLLAILLAKGTRGWGR